MKLVRSLIAASLLAGIVPSVVFADCNPPCKGDRVCRYDSTHNPQFFCRKPVAPQAAASPAPAAPGVAPAPATGSLTAKQGTGSVTGKGPSCRFGSEMSLGLAKESSANSKTSKTDNCAKGAL
jgi:hypothetical protein